MKKLILLIAMFLITTQISAAQCSYPLNTLIENNLRRIQNPYFVQIEKARVDSEEQPPVIMSYETVYSSSQVPSDDFLTPERLFEIYKGNIVKEEISSDIHKEMKTLIMYPIMNINKGYVSGIMILGYNKEVQNNYQFFTGIELLSSYLTQAIETCKQE